MDTPVRGFFNRFYQILGCETQAQRDELMLKFEDTLVRRTMARFMAGLQDKEKRKYEEFVRVNPKASNEEVAAFLRALQPRFDFGELFNNEARILTEAYVKKVLLTATEDQKQQIKAVFEQMFSDIKQRLT